jgi:hypothetical protein
MAGSELRFERAPRLGGLGEAVQKHDGSTAAGSPDMERRPFDRVSGRRRPGSQAGGSRLGWRGHG